MVACTETFIVYTSDKVALIWQQGRLFFAAEWLLALQLPLLILNKLLIWHQLPIAFAKAWLLTLQPSSPTQKKSLRWQQWSHLLGCTVLVAYLAAALFGACHNIYVSSVQYEIKIVIIKLLIFQLIAAVIAYFVLTAALLPAFGRLFSCSSRLFGKIHTGCPVYM